MNNLLRMLQDERQLNNVELDEAFQQQPPIMLRGVEPSVEEVIREPAVEQPQLLQEEIDYPGLTDEEFAAQIKEPGVVGSGRRTPEEMNELRGQEGIEPDKPKTILDELRELRQQSDKELKDARAMDVWMRLANQLNKAFSKFDQASALKATGVPGLKAIGGDSAVPEDSAQMVLQDRQQKIKDLMEQLKLGSALEPKPLSELDRAKIESEKAKAEKYKADASKALAAKTKEEPSIFEKKKLEGIAKNAVEFRQQGAPNIKSNLRKIDEAIKLMEDTKDSLWDKVSGPARGLFPDLTRKFTNAKAIDARDKIYSSIQSTLRETLGAQFTEKEGERILSLSFDETQDPQVNIDRAKELRRTLTEKLKYQQDLYDYIEQNGSDRGFDHSKYDVDLSEPKGKTRIQMPDGQLFNVDSDKVEALMKKYPNAKIME